MKGFGNIQEGSILQVSVRVPHVTHLVYMIHLSSSLIESAQIYPASLPSTALKFIAPVTVEMCDSSASQDAQELCKEGIFIILTLESCAGKITEVCLFLSVGYNVKNAKDLLMILRGKHYHTISL